MREESNFFKRVTKFWRGIVSGKRGHPNQKVKQVATKEKSISSEKQKELEALCEELFTQKELIAAGKLQFLGLKRVKDNLGKNWDRLKLFVFDTVEEAIKKYFLPGDLFIRYKNDTYVIIFSQAESEEARIKTKLIAEEIKRNLFNHEEEAFQDIEIEESVTVIKTESLKESKSFEEKMDVVFSNDDVPTPNKDKKPVTVKHTVEIDPYADNQKMKSDQSQTGVEREKQPDHVYVPLWDVKKNILRTYLCLTQRAQFTDNPFDSYETLFLGIPAMAKAKKDINLLKIVVKDLEKSVEENDNISIVCPVHYETLLLGEAHRQYIMICQKIPEESKNYLTFMIVGLPETISDLSISQYFGTLRNHCSKLYAQVPLNTKIDFYLLSQCRFDAVGTRLKRAINDETKINEMLQNFSKSAKSALIQKIFVFDTDSSDIVKLSVNAEFDIIGGSAVHDIVQKPNDDYHFVDQNILASVGGK